MKQYPESSLSYQKQDCPMCQGEGRIEESVMGGYYNTHSQSFEPLIQERECSLCRGCGTVDYPAHENTFNHTPEYSQLKQARAGKRSSTNKVVAQILGLTVEELETQEFKRAA